jgi:hypothetical protein
MDQLGKRVTQAAWSVSEVLGATAAARDLCTMQASAPISISAAASASVSATAKRAR